MTDGTRDVGFVECAEALMGRTHCPAQPPESEVDYVRRMFRELFRRLVLPPEHGADSIDAAIGYALKRCQEEVMAALYASNGPRPDDAEGDANREPNREPNREAGW